MRTILLILSVLVIPSVVSGQVTPTSRVAWDQDAPSLAVAQAYTYRSFIDASTTGTILVHACTGAAQTFVCTAPFPSFTPGSHSIQITASNSTGESLKSVPLVFTFAAIPAVPQRIRIIPPPA